MGRDIYNDLCQFWTQRYTLEHVWPGLKRVPDLSQTWRFSEESAKVRHRRKPKPPECCWGESSHGFHLLCGFSHEKWGSNLNLKHDSYIQLPYPKIRIEWSRWPQHTAISCRDRHESKAEFLLIVQPRLWQVHGYCPCESWKGCFGDIMEMCPDMWNWSPGIFESAWKLGAQGQVMLLDGEEADVDGSTPCAARPNTADGSTLYTLTLVQHGCI